MKREEIKKRIREQLKVPRFTVKSEDYERSEHFGQIQIDLVGEVAIENTNYDLYLDYLHPEDLKTALAELFISTMYVRDPDLRFCVEVAPLIRFMSYCNNKLEVRYEWQEV